jgi:hypothetical protein
LEITCAGTGAYPAQVSGVQAQYHSGQVFITWDEIGSADPETAYRVYRHTSAITEDNLFESEMLDEARAGSASFPRLLESDWINTSQVSTPFSQGPLPKGKGLYVYTVESAGDHYYAVTSIVRGNENRSVKPANSAGPVRESVAAVNPVLQALEVPDLLAAGNRQVFMVWLGRFDSSGRYVDYGYSNRRSTPYLFRIITPETWDPTAAVPLLVFFHYFSDSYVGGGQNAAQPRFVLTADDYDPLITANLYGASMWYGYNSNYGTHRAPADGVVVNYTERRVDWIVDWVMKRSPFRIDPNRVYMKGGSMGGAAQWGYGIRRPQLFAAGENGVPAVNLNFDPNQRHYSLWGYEPTILTNEGAAVEARVNAGAYAASNPGVDFPLMLTFARKGDVDVPWGQYPAFFATMDSSRHLGGILYWTQGEHAHGEEPSQVFPEWSSTEEYDDWIYQFVHDQSYPAFSNFTLNGDPGRGDPAAGDPRGGFNRFPRWDTADIVDTPGRWEMTMRLHSAAPSSAAAADVTLRRLQALVHTPGAAYSWENRQGPGEVVVQSGEVSADENGLITLPRVVLSKAGNRIAVYSGRSGRGRRHRRADAEEPL